MHKSDWDPRFVAGALSKGRSKPCPGLERKPRSYLGLFERCRVYLHLGSLAEAEADCLEARQLARPEDFGLHALVGNVYLREGRLGEALREFERYLRRDSASPTAAAVREMVQSLRKAGVNPEL